MDAPRRTSGARRPRVPPREPAPAAGARGLQHVRGRGACAARLGRRSTTVTGLDPDEAATSRCAAARPGVELRRLDDARRSGSRRRSSPHAGVRAGFDSTEARGARAGAGASIRRSSQDYAAVLWEYWEEHAGPGPRPCGRTRRRRCAARSSSSPARRRASARRPRSRSRAAGGVPLLVARTREKLEEVQREIEAPGGTAYVYPCDLSDSTRSTAGRATCSPTRPGRHPRQQRGPLDPPLGRALLRPLPRLRAHDAAQLLRAGPADPRAAAAHARARVGPDRERVARSACRRARRASPPTSRRRPRSTRSAGASQPRCSATACVHDDPHAARAHADDRADDDLRRLPGDHAGGGRRT